MRKAGGNIARGKTIGFAQVLVFPLASPFPGHAENRGLTSTGNQSLPVWNDGRKCGDMKVYVRLLLGEKADML